MYALSIFFFVPNGKFDSSLKLNETKKNGELSFHRYLFLFMFLEQINENKLLKQIMNDKVWCLNVDLSICNNVTMQQCIIHLPSSIC